MGVELKDHLISPMFRRRCTHLNGPIGTNSTNPTCRGVRAWAIVWLKELNHRAIELTSALAFCEEDFS